MAFWSATVCFFLFIFPYIIDALLFLDVKLGANEEDELKSALQVLFDRVMFEKETLKPDIDSLLKKHSMPQYFTCFNTVYLFCDI